MGSEEHRGVYGFVRNLLKRICYTQGLASEVEMCEGLQAETRPRRRGEPAERDERKVLYDNSPGQQDLRCFTHHLLALSLLLILGACNTWCRKSSCQERR